MTGTVLRRPLRTACVTMRRSCRRHAFACTLLVALPVWLVASGMSGRADGYLNQTTTKEFGKGAFSSDTPGLTLPEPKTTPEVKYTAAALRAHIEGEVNLDIVVDADGSVREARLSKEKPKTPLHGREGAATPADELFGQLRDNALRAVSTWTFTPGQLRGKAIAVVITHPVQFRIH